jgi:serine/threonine-protein phosphatase 2A regulatory subunit B''
MEVEAARRDASALDPELLQLPELAPGALRENSSIADALYAQWLVLPETSKLVTSRAPSRPSRATLDLFLGWPGSSVDFAWLA